MKFENESPVAKRGIGWRVLLSASLLHMKLVIFVEMSSPDSFLFARSLLHELRTG